ncbi:MAG: hypothetical protein WBM09_03080 [Gallionella sp.]
MAKHQIFLVHGMGDFETHWSLDVQKQIQDTFAAYKKVASKSLVDHFEFVNVGETSVGYSL